METYKIGFVKLHQDAKIPTKTGHDTDACYDVWCTDLKYINEKTIRYYLGFTLNLPKDVKVNIYPRSSIYKTGLVLCNSVGTIDEDYTGEYMAHFYHIVSELEPYKIGDKIAQIEINHRNNIIFYETDQIKESVRGSDGFGSTGLK